MQLDSLLRGKILLLQLKLRRQIEQSQLLFLLGNHFIKKRKMVAEKDNARSIVHLRILANISFKKYSRHRRDVLMAEAQVCLSKPRVARLNRRNTNFALFAFHVPCEDFFR